MGITQGPDLELGPESHRVRTVWILRDALDRLNDLLDDVIIYVADRWFPEPEEQPSRAWIDTRVTCGDCGTTTWVSMPVAQYDALGRGNIEAPHDCTARGRT